MTDTDDAKVVPLASRRCPICRRPAVHRFRPFCSRRCQQIDLGRWVGGDYRIPTEEESGFDDGPGAGHDEG